MATAIAEWDCSIVEAASRAADCYGFTAETVRLWANTYITTTAATASENITDEFIAASSCRIQNNHTESTVDDEAFQIAARAFVRKNANKQNLTCKMFVEWIKAEYNVKVHEETVRLWLQKLGISRMHHQKGVYFHGHDQEDLVMYRNGFLEKMVESDRRSIMCNNRVFDIPTDEKPLICAVHDQCTFYANCDQSYFWGDKQTKLMFFGKSHWVYQ